MPAYYSRARLQRRDSNDLPRRMTSVPRSDREACVHELRTGKTCAGIALQCSLYYRDTDATYAMPDLQRWYVPLVHLWITGPML